MKPDCAPTRLLTWLRWAPLVALLASLPSHAQYKVIGPDGKVTYTDRPPTTTEGKVTSLTDRSSAAAADASLPLDLRQPVARYPVVLYTLSGSCALCESARQLLRQRGIPFNEKQVQSAEDSEALERLSGGRDAPTLGVGSPTLRGLAPEVWGSYLDAAGYPRESRLPATYRYPAATTITQKRESNESAAAPAEAPRPYAAPGPTPANPANIKF